MSVVSSRVNASVGNPSIRRYGHGLLWKSLGVLSKIGFLFLVVPDLKEGEFSKYVLALTAGLISARVLSLGAEEQLTIEIKNSKDKANEFIPLFWAYWSTSWIGILTIHAFGMQIVGIDTLVLALVLAAGFLIGGMLRGISPPLFELYLNLPWIVFLILCTICAPTNSLSLVVLLSISSLSVHFCLVRICGLAVTVRWRNLKASIQSIYLLAPKSAVKACSFLIVVANMRALIVWPKIAFDVLIADALALALTIGETMWQLAMVFVNRHFSDYCVSRPNLKKAVIWALAYFFAFSMLGLLCYLCLPESLNGKFQPALVGLGILLFGSFAGIMEVRACLIAGNRMKGVSSMVLMLLFFVQGGVVGFLPSSYWLVCAAMSCGGFLLFFILMSLRLEQQLRPCLRNR